MWYEPEKTGLADGASAALVTADPVGIVLGLVAGFISRKLFDRLWALIDREDPPKPTTRETTWPKVLAAAAVEGVTFKVTRAAVDRAGARGFAALTGTWPGEKRPEQAE